jgi:hypothetical protein
VTRLQAEAALIVLRSKYPDAEIEAESDLEADIDDTDAGADGYAIAVNGVVAETIEEISAQLEEDFGDDPVIGQLRSQLGAITA